MNSNSVLSIKNIYKEYQTRKSLFPNNRNIFSALNNVSLDILRGERIGVVGGNGSGKTTLLKIISGITIPTSGDVIRKGSLNSFIDLSSGFHPDLSGLDNIMLNGLMSGITRSQMKSKVKEIIEMSGIGAHIEMPFYTYSSGMKLRLAFAIAINSNVDILVFDEIVSAGDRYFIKMFQKYFKKIMEDRKTIIMSTHILELLPMYCDKLIWLEKGKIKMIGDVNKILNEYKKKN